MRAQRHLGLLLEPGDDVDGVTAHDGRVRPVERAFQRRRHHRCRQAPHPGDPRVTHFGLLGARGQHPRECPIRVGPEDHPLLRAVQGKAVVEQLGALLAPVAAPVAAGGAVAVEAGKDVEGVGSRPCRSPRVRLIGCGYRPANHGETHRRRPARRPPQGARAANRRPECIGAVCPTGAPVLPDRTPVGGVVRRPVPADGEPARRRPVRVAWPDLACACAGDDRVAGGAGGRAWGRCGPGARTRSGACASPSVANSAAVSTAERTSSRSERFIGRPVVVGGNMCSSD